MNIVKRNTQLTTISELHKLQTTTPDFLYILYNTAKKIITYAVRIYVYVNYNLKQ